MTPKTVVERTQKERSEATTRALVDAARKLFSRRGYASTSLDDVAEAAGVSKGAVYHHFDSKQELFRAVFEREERKLAGIVAVAYRNERDPWKGFFAGCKAFLEELLDPGVARIAILDAPGVLEWEEMRRIQANYTLEPIKRALGEAMDAGVIAKRPIEPLAHLLFGACCEGAMVAARSDDQRAMTRKVTAELRTMLESLRIS